MALFDLPSPQRDAWPLRQVAGLLALMSYAGIGAGKALLLADRYASWEELRAAEPESLRKLIGAAHVALAEPPPPTRPAPDGVTVIGFFDDSFPIALKAIPSPPAVLWVRGQLDQLAGAVAIVGTRQPTPQGLAATRALSARACQLGAPVVSGLALGVDAVAHEACLAVGGRTLAVLGSGVDVPSPSQHRDLAARILEAGGALISEMPPGTAPSARTLVARNRLQAGLSRTVVIAQCGIPSGTLHTAGFALQQSRTLAAVTPDPAEDPARWRGNTALLDPAGLATLGAQELPATLLKGAAGRRPAAQPVSTPDDLEALL